MSSILLQVRIPLCLLLIFSMTAPPLFGASTDLTGKFAKYRLSEQVNLPSIPFEQTIGQNVTEAVVEQLSNGSFVSFQIQVANRIVSMRQFFSNGSMVFPIIGANTLSDPNSTANQIRSSFNLTFIQPNTTRTTTPFKVVSQDISFNGSTYSGNLYSGVITMTVNVTRAFNLTQYIPLLPLKIDVIIETFPSDLLYSLTASNNINLPGSSGTGKFQMTLLSTNLPLGDPIIPPWYAALILILPIGFLAYMIYRRRRAAKRLAQQSSNEKPSYWVH